MTVLAWTRGARVWSTIEVRRPTTADRRAPYDGESVIIRSFWDRHGTGIVFHRRWYPGTFCDPGNRHRHTACGHALPLSVAVQIARPCRRCYL